jgi:predicted ATPase
VTLTLASVHIKNFKAIKDSQVVKFEPLTVFIGENGAGKSSLIEALETWQRVAVDGLNTAISEPWLGFESVWHKLAQGKLTTIGRSVRHSPMHFEMRGKWKEETFHAITKILPKDNSLEVFIETDQIKTVSGTIKTTYRRIRERIDVYEEITAKQPTLRVASLADRSLLSVAPAGFIQSWQFASIIPQIMGIPSPQKRTRGQVILNKDGSNIADYLRDINRLDLDNDTNIFQEIIETLKEVLPYSNDLQPLQTDEKRRSLYLGLSESSFEVEGWMLSTGTLRCLSILALLRHPFPPPLIFIEEIENGLSPKTLSLIAKEIQIAVKNKKTQVIISTQSPYLLDLVSLKQIVVVARDENGQPTFTGLSDQKSLLEWAVNFTPGQLFAMGLIRGGETKGCEFKVAAIYNSATKAKDITMPDNIVQAVVAFLNSEDGGFVVIGVHDSGTIVGLGKDEYSSANKAHSDSNHYELFLRDKIKAGIGSDDLLDLIEFKFEKVNGKELCILKIKPSHRAAYFKGDFYIRTGNKKQKLSSRDTVKFCGKRFP